MFVPYTGYVLDLGRAWLQRFALGQVSIATADDDESGVAGGRKKAKRSKADAQAVLAAAPAAWPTIVQLWRAWLGTLHKAFLYDPDRTAAPCAMRAGGGGERL